MRFSKPRIVTGLVALAILVAPIRAPAASRRRRGRPGLIIAHRGASGYLPEHSLVAKAYAHAQGADYIEQDVVLTSDDVPMVLHDRYLDTVTDVASVYPLRKRDDGRFYAIDFTLAEIRRLRLFERIDRKTGKRVYPKRYPLQGRLPFPVPTLAEEIRLIQGLNASTGRHAGLYVELKAPWFHRREGKDIARIVLALLSKFDYREKSDKIYVQCFDPACLKRMRRVLKTRLKLVQLIASNAWGETPHVDYDAMLTEKGIAQITRYADGIGPWINQIFTLGPRGRAIPNHALVA